MDYVQSIKENCLLKLSKSVSPLRFHGLGTVIHTDGRIRNRHSGGLNDAGL